MVRCELEVKLEKYLRDKSFKEDGGDVPGKLGRKWGERVLWKVKKCHPPKVSGQRRKGKSFCLLKEMLGKEGNWKGDRSIKDYVSVTYFCITNHLKIAWLRIVVMCYFSQCCEMPGWFFWLFTRALHARNSTCKAGWMEGPRWPRSDEWISLAGCQGPLFSPWPLTL